MVENSTRKSKLGGISLFLGQEEEYQGDIRKRAVVPLARNLAAS
jgi:hypothetical protein